MTGPNPVRSAATDPAADQEVALTPMRRAIGRAMTQSKQQIPHFAVSSEIDVEDLTTSLAGQEGPRTDGPRNTLTAHLLLALTRTLEQHPEFNAIWRGEALVRRDDINIGVAVAVDGGLVAPAILRCNGMAIDDITAALADLVGRAHGGRLRAAEVTEGTFTLSNLGMFGVPRFTAIIAPPQVAILAVGSAIERPVVRDGQIIARRILEVNLSSDHRAVDGADAARFLVTLRGHLQGPVSA